MRITRSQSLANYQKRVKNKHKKIYLGIAGLLIVATCFIFSTQIQNIWVQFVYKPAQTQLLDINQIRRNQVTAPKIGNQTPKTDKAISESVKLGDIVNASKYRKNMSKYIIGAIYLPHAANVSLPVLLGNPNPKIQKEALAVGAVTPISTINFNSDNFTVGSHQMLQRGVEFSNLIDQKSGDKVYLTDTINVYTYKVYRKVEIDPSQVSIMTQHRHKGKRILTMYTCNSDGSKREVVQAYRSKTTKYNKMPKKITKHFNFSSKKKEKIV